MKPQKQKKQILKFALKMMDKVVEIKYLEIEHQKAKNEEIRLKQSPTVELLEVKSSDEQIDEKLKREVENDPMFKILGEIFDPQKNAKRAEEIIEKYPKGGIIVGVGKLQDKGEFVAPKFGRNECNCPVCQAERNAKNN